MKATRRPSDPDCKRRSCFVDAIQQHGSNDEIDAGRVEQRQDVVFFLQPFNLNLTIGGDEVSGF
ncbi:MAG: hypothetical protein ABIO50_07515 [Nitrosospira sp.]